MNVKQMYACAGLSLLLVSSVTSHAMDRKAQIGLGSLGVLAVVGGFIYYYTRPSAASTVDQTKAGKNPPTKIVVTPPETGSPRTSTQDIGSPRTAQETSSPRITTPGSSQPSLRHQ